MIDTTFSVIPNTRWINDQSAVLEYNGWQIGGIEKKDDDPRLWWFSRPAHRPTGQPQCGWLPMVVNDFGELVPCLALFENWVQS
jgi:hypothetical protein